MNLLTLRGKITRASTRILNLVHLLLIGSLVAGCTTPQSPQTDTAIATDVSLFPLKKLSDYGYFEGRLADLIPRERVLLYEPAATLFTDYAFKKRFVWLPEGEAALVPTNSQDPLDFPDGAVLIKHFYYPTDFRQPEGEKRLLETRLLVKKAGKWEAYPYHWNEEQTDAVYKVTGGATQVRWVDEAGENREVMYAFPNKNQCKSCHNQNKVMKPIGPKVKQLNHDLVFEQGKKAINQLDKWTQMGYLQGTWQRDIRLVHMDDPSASLDARARSYLDVNCAHCHSASGPAATSGLYLNIEEERPFHLGIKKSPVAAGIGAGAFKFDINPGHGEASILTHRMNSTDPAVMMPEIGRTSIHKEGYALIKSWIDQLPQ